MKNEVPTNKLKKVFTVAAMIASLIIAFVIFEFYKSRDELLSILKNESENLSSSLSISFENSLASNDAVSTIYSNQMRAYAFIVEHSAPDLKRNPNEIESIKNKYDIEHIAIINKKGEILLNSNQNGIKSISNSLMSELNPIFNNDCEWLDFGIIDYELSKAQSYLFAQKIKDSDKCVLITISAKKVLELSNKISIGKQIQKIASGRDIVYIVLQDTLGIVSATKTINELQGIKADTFLFNVFESGKINSRLIDYNSSKIYEAAQVITLPYGEKLLTRIAISTDYARSVQQRSMRRVIIIGIVIFALFTIFYALLTTSKGFDKLKKEHKTITSYNDLVLENITDAVVAVDSSGIIRYFNNKASLLFNIPKQTALDKPYLDIFPNDRLSLYNFKKDEIEYISDDKSIKYLQIAVSYVYSQPDVKELTIAFIKDLTEKKLLDIVLGRKEKLTAMGELAAGVAHEIRNPLNSISVLAQRIAREFKPDNRQEDFQKFINTIREEISRVNNIIKQFLEFTGNPKLNKSPYNLSDVIIETINLFETQAIESGVSIQSNIISDLWYNFDKEKIKQVIINLFKNAIEAMPNGGILTCEVNKSENQIIISISDTGVGIDESELTQIFNIYFTTKEAGTGLGLSIVHKIINDHGGIIRVQSKKGLGTNFRIYLPL